MSRPDTIPTAAKQPGARVAWTALAVGVINTVLLRAWPGDWLDTFGIGSMESGPYLGLLAEIGLAALPAFVGLALVLERLLTESAVRRIRSGLASSGTRWICACVSVAFSALIAAVVYDFAPITNGDEDAYAFQAALFATGRSNAPAPPVPEAFPALARVVHDGRWFAMAFPGHPLVLSAGTILGMPWLSVAVVSFLSVLAIGAVGSRLLGPTGGGVAAALATLSPHVLYMQGSLLSQPTTALALLLLILLSLHLESRPGVGIALATGLAWGALFLVRPPTAVTMGLAWLAWRIWRLRLGGDLRRWIRLVATAGLGAGVGVLAYVAYNAHLSGAWGGSIYGLAMRGDPMGFSEWRLVRKVVDHAANIVRFNFYLFGWPISLLFCLRWLRDGLPGRELRALSLSVIPLCTLYAFHFAGHYWYWHELYIPATLITASVIASILDGTAGAGAMTARRAVAVVAAGWMCSAVFVVPFLNERYSSFIAARAAVLSDLPPPGSPQLVVVRSLPPVEDLPRRRFNGRNDPDLSNPRLFAIDAGGDCVARLSRAFPDRQLLLYEYDAASGRMKVDSYPSPVAPQGAGHEEGMR